MNREADTAVAASATPRSPTRQALLVALLRDGPLAPEALARRVGLSRTAVLHQLRALETSGLVERQSIRHGVGRPRHLYDATAHARIGSTADHEMLVESLIEAIATTGGPTLLRRVIEAAGMAQRRRIAEQIDHRVRPNASLVERAAALVQVFGEQGLVWDLRNGTGLALVSHTCPLYRLASATPELCRMDHELIGDVLGARVVRESSIVGGDRRCVYRVVAASPTDSGSSSGRSAQAATPTDRS